MPWMESTRSCCIYETKRTFGCFLHGDMRKKTADKNITWHTAALYDTKYGAATYRDADDQERKD